MKSSSCLVTGSTGVIGPRLVQALVDGGLAVKVLVRDNPPAELLPSPIRQVKGDLLDKDALHKAVAGVDTIFHLAAKLHINNPDPALQDEYRRVNFEGTRLLLEKAKAAGVRRFVYFSTIKVYGASRPGQVITELDGLAPDDIYAQTKSEAESCVLEVRSPETQAQMGVVLRLAAVYGPNMKGNYPRLVNALRKGRFIPLGNGKNRRTLVHEKDVVAAALLAAKQPQAAGQLYNITDGQIHTLSEIMDAICRVLKKPLPRFYLPTAPVRLVVGAVEDAFRLIGKPSPIARSTIDKFVEDVAVSGEKFQREFNFRPQFDLVEGWRDTVNSSRTV